LGIVPTPTVALATKKHNCRGIMLTASHNPPEYNGLKLIEHGKEIGKILEKEVTKDYKIWEQNAHSRLSSVSTARLVRDPTIISDHINHVIGMVDVSAIARKNLKVVVDCNGAASTITPYLLAELGCKVISVNATTDGFNRPSEPSKENLWYLSDFVRDIGADFAVAHDGDGDRCIVIDDVGEALPFDVQLAMMIEHEMEKSNNKKIVSTVESSLAIRQVVEQNGGKIEITPVGSTYVGDVLEAEGALFGGEPCGEYIYQKGVHVPDAIMAVGKFVEMAALSGKFSVLKKKFKQNPMFRGKFKAPDKHKSMEKIIPIIEGMKLPGRLRVDDGIRVDEEGGWFLVRASGTEPLIRLTMEYNSSSALENRKKQLEELITNSI